MSCSCLSLFNPWLVKKGQKIQQEKYNTDDKDGVGFTVMCLQGLATNHQPFYRGICQGSGYKIFHINLKRLCRHSIGLVCQIAIHVE